MNHKQLQSLHHIAIPVRDIDRAIAWYTSRFACELKYRDGTQSIYIQDSEGNHVEIIQS